MATQRIHDVQTQEERVATAPAEATRPGVLLTPPVDIFEDRNAITVLADMPGVRSSDLTIDLHDGVLTITGHAQVSENPHEVSVLHEYPAGTFPRSFTPAEAIDQGKIEAVLKNGVLRLRLPKVERAKPRQITIQTE
jgi:HSP20 family molecular chaperone IbpA